jgi:hypothetical protein
MGASLEALTRLGARLGYSLAGTTLMGLNAFFVRNDLVEEKFQRPFSAQNHYNRRDFLWPYIAGHTADWGRWVQDGIKNPAQLGRARPAQTLPLDAQRAYYDITVFCTSRIRMRISTSAASVVRFIMRLQGVERRAGGCQSLYLYQGCAADGYRNGFPVK